MYIGSTPLVESSSLGSNNVRVSPLLRSSNCWGEQRASFSDVVARHDIPLYSSIVAPRKHTLQQQQQASQVASSLFVDSSSSSSTSSNNGSNTARKVPEPSTPTNTSAGLGE
jgi:hypothetical protein